MSGIAALPRIVTLHDIEIKSVTKDAYDQLTLDLTAKTYRYLDEDELAAGGDSKKDGGSRWGGMGKGGDSSKGGDDKKGNPWSKR